MFPAVPIEPPRRQLVFAPASSAGGAVEPGSEPGCDKSSKLAILDLMTLWVSSHSYRFRYVATRNVLCAKILRVLRYRESHLVLGVSPLCCASFCYNCMLTCRVECALCVAGIRFLKQCIGKDQHYHGYVHVSCHSPHRPIESLFAVVW